MARISGVDLPRENVKSVFTYIYGIGRTSAKIRILKAADVNPDTRVRDLTDDEVLCHVLAISSMQIISEGDLRREIAMNIKRLQEIGCHRGIRHRKVIARPDRRQRQTLEHVKVLRKLLQNKKK